jgi:hypothetical protein
MIKIGNNKGLKLVINKNFEIQSEIDLNSSHSETILAQVV